MRATFARDFQEPPTGDCPRCGWTYLADTEEDLDVGGADDYEYAATVRLERECPDHAHAFVVGE